MLKKELDNALELVSEELKKSGISRRDAFKLAGLSSATFLMSNTQVQAVTTNISKVKAKILIIGGGLSGISTAARLSNTLSNPNITIIDPNPKSISYQAGNTLIGAGIYEKADVMYNTKDFLPSGTTLIKDKAVEFNPDNNLVKLESGKVIIYDFLIIAAGLKLDFGRIKGLESVGEAYSLGDAKEINDIFANSGVCSIYNTDLAVSTWTAMQKLIEQAKNGQKVRGIFTHPSTSIKCLGAPKNIMYLTNSRLIEAGARNNTELVFYSYDGKMFDVPEYHDAIVKQFEQRELKWNYNHNLIGINLEKNIATFDKYWEEKGEYDKDNEDYIIVKKHLDVEVDFDFMHITPPMKAPDEIANSIIGSEKGWVPVNKETLQHVKFDNIFAIGDIADVPMGKTAGSIRKQYKVLVDNLVATIEGKELKSKYTGYTVCPLTTDIGKAMLAEFNWTKKPISSLYLDPTQERYIWWLMKVYLLKPITMYGMLSGKV